MLEIRGKIGLLAQMPQIGINRSEELGGNIHSYFVGSHTVYYKYDSKTLVVHAVLHQAMIPQLHLK